MREDQTMTERFVATREGRGRWRVWDHTNKSAHDWFTSRQSAEYRAAALNRREREVAAHDGYATGERCPHPVCYQEGVNCHLCEDTGIIQAPTA